ncbi:MerR family transcriptional regulator [Umezawaea sp. Da 62-37]|uniref:MerR family transcriptional regulator n=1 Tax=Umezawaea sp. Da 62-37 TaxID=3075927 RepID=UPI0028F6D534|nr:MerR family transcriptional regulator [Umezawaea sp. Da 62-37]WNV91436.1 MerR family transcriptional regulator [Umezawaea sp. Da 62-37]
MLLAIGEVARRTGLTVKAVRFYADRGLVPPVGRDRNGHRLFSDDAIVRSGLVRTLRDLGVALPEIREILDRGLRLSDVASTHADALGVRIRVLRRQQAVLRLAAERDLAPLELKLVHELVGMSEVERRDLVGGFLEVALEGVDPGVRRSMTPELCRDPSDVQVAAWVELVGLVRDLEFGGVLRRVVENYLADGVGLGRDLVAVVRDECGVALGGGVEVDSGEAGVVVGRVVGWYAGVVGSEGVGGRLVERVEAAGDPRRERYGELVAVINGWEAPEGVGEVLRWFGEALRVHGVAA